MADPVPSFDTLPSELRALREDVRELRQLVNEIKNPVEENYLSQDDLMKILKISKQTVWRWSQKGILRPLRIGNLVRYRKSDIERVLVECGGTKS